MTRRTKPNHRKAFFTILALSIVSTGILYAIASITNAPQADTTFPVHIRGVILYGSNKPKDNEQVRIFRVKSDGSTNAVTDPFSHSDGNNDKVTTTPNRSYSQDFTGIAGATYRITLNPEKCSVDFTLKSSANLSGKTRIEYNDTVFNQSAIDSSANPNKTDFNLLDRIHADCTTNTTTPTPTVAPTSTSTSTTGLLPTPTPGATSTSGGGLLPTPTSTFSSGSGGGLLSPTPTSGSTTTTSSGAVTFQAPFCSPQYNIVYLIDNSGSMADQDSRNALMKKFVKQALATNRYLTKDRGALVTFSNPSDVKVELTSDFQSLTDRVTSLGFAAGGSTISGGVRQAVSYLTSSGGAHPTIVIVISDDKSVLGNTALTDAKNAMTSVGARFFTIAVGGGNNNGLSQLAQSGGGTYSKLAQDSQLDSTVKNVFDTADSLVDNCVTASVTSDKTTLVDGETANLTFSYTNNTRRTLSDAVLTQLLPSGLVGTDGSLSLSLRLNGLASGQTTTQTVQVKGSN